MFYFTLLEIVTNLDEMEIEQKLNEVCKRASILGHVCNWFFDREGWIFNIRKDCNHPFFGYGYPFFGIGYGNWASNGLEVKIIFDKQKPKLLQFKTMISNYSGSKTKRLKRKRNSFN